ncbi:hypothetical protein [uncultured Kordia sp.]|uniref:hypothetical protein n=1 Tax=uncultured Kordia sp. TaxID=507699 RepID=UPI00260916AF|nr:hypothetical protein [uncultured Kordia sp.]
MKKVLFSLLLFIFIFSCQKEEIQNEEETAAKTPVITKSLRAINNSYTEREIMEINLRWTAFITGYVLRHNSEAQHEVATLLQNGNRVIKLSDLLVEGSAFHFEFIGYIGDYLNITEGMQGNPNVDKTRPNPPPQGIDDGEAIPNNTTIAVGITIDYIPFFMDYILTENCIELYFPKSMVFAGQFSITSAGHSMTDKNLNDGIIRYYNEQLIDGEYFFTDNVIVNDRYIQNNDNIIIARPYRNTNTTIGGIDCNYTQYNDIVDFTDFLDY